MTDEIPPEPPHPGQLMEEAALWLARMRGPEAETHRAEFDAWLARGALHRSAYNRTAEIFSLGKFLSDEEERPAVGFGSQAVEPSDSPAPSRALRRGPMILLATCVLLVIGLAVLAKPFSLHLGQKEGVAGTGMPAQMMRFATRSRETRLERLADGSVITLQPDSSLSAAYSAGRRALHLERGSARFEVAHDFRPFVVEAGGGAVTARGTVFEVRLAADARVTVRLLDGSVDVVMPAASRNRAAVRRLTPGQSVSYGSPAGSADPGKDERGGSASSTAPSIAIEPMRAFDRVPLADVLAQANRGASARILLADPALGQRPVSGQFRIGDTQRLAERLAWIFDLRIDRNASGDILLSER
ncbi:FecR family protein [Sphingomonas koreensis]